MDVTRRQLFAVAALGVVTVAPAGRSLGLSPSCVPPTVEELERMRRLLDTSPEDGLAVVFVPRLNAGCGGFATKRFSAVREGEVFRLFFAASGGRAGYDGASYIACKDAYMARHHDGSVLATVVCDVVHDRADDPFARFALPLHWS